MDEPAPRGNLHAEPGQSLARVLCQKHLSRGRPDPRGNREFRECELRERCIWHARVRRDGAKPPRKPFIASPSKFWFARQESSASRFRWRKSFPRFPIHEKPRPLPANYDGLTQAILTTDTRPKWAAAQCRIGGKQVRLLGCAKGAGMIHPNMATMLAYVVTDAEAAPEVLAQRVDRCAGRTFNSITVDGDTSTNDTALVIASGASGAPALSRIRQ